MELDNELVSSLGEAAAEAARNAYAPYSGFHVAAIALTSQGERFGGVNMENASYGMALCAEAGALSAATAAGAFDRVEAIVVIGGRMEGGALGGNQPVMPCGRCRQLIFETASLQGRDIPIFAFSGDRSQVIATSIRHLLPDAFGPGNL